MHIHALFSFTSVAAALMADRRGIPYVIRPLGTLNRYGITQRRPWLKKMSLAMIEGPILRRAAAVHFTSEGEREEASALEVPMREVVIPLAAEHECPNDDQDLLQDYPSLHGRQVILFLSRLDPKKNLECLIDALASSVPLRQNAGLLVAGTGEHAYVDSLRARALKAGVEGMIVWLGHVEGATKRAAFAAADIFALPSYSENFGIAAVEAMLAGLPVVLGQGVAISQEVNDADAGITVAPDPPCVAEALELLVTNDSLRRRMGSHARAFAEREYSAAVMTERLIALYEEIKTLQRRRWAVIAVLCLIFLDHNGVPLSKS